MDETNKIQYSKIGVLSFAHMLNDFYSNFLPQLLPFLIIAGNSISATRAAILVSSFTVSSSLLQPVFGIMLDRQGKRWLVHVGALWMAVMLSLTGIVQSYALLVILAFLAGLGTAAFHPQASTMINTLSGDHKGVLLSAFVAFGSFGIALSPLLLVPLFQTYGLHSTLITVIPGILAAVFLLLFAPKDTALKGTSAPLSEVAKSLKSASTELGVLMGVIAIRSLAYTAMITMLPLYFKSENVSNVAASQLVTIMLASGAVGGVIGGFVSDFFGRKRLIVLSLIISTPLFLAFFFTHGTVSTIFLALAGAALLSSFSVTVVAAQEAIPQNKALASGLSMGFAGGVGGLLAILIGRAGDIWGLSTALVAIFMLPVLGGLLALFMKSRPAARAQRAAVLQE
jgi:MFS transporter, FSR family, fosmidomycin resistance protein